MCKDPLLGYLCFVFFRLVLLFLGHSVAIPKLSTCGFPLSSNLIDNIPP